MKQRKLSLCSMTKNSKDASSLSMKLARWKLAHRALAVMADTEAAAVDAENTSMRMAFTNRHIQIISRTKMPERAFLFRRNTFVSVDGIEPSTSVLSGQRSTTELHAQ